MAPNFLSSRERLLTAIDHRPPDHTPLCAWAFGFRAPPGLRWMEGGREAEFWYTGRLEHLHTLPQPWDVTHDFRRVDAWLSLGLDDALEVSVPWSADPRVRFRDTAVQDPDGPGQILAREYDTPDGPLRHAVRRTSEAMAPGWVVQPDCVPLFEDFNIPRAVQHLVDGPAAVERARWLYQSPGPAEADWLAARMAQVAPFARDRGVLTQAWAAFGVDAVVWMAGVENAVLLAMEHPDAFEAWLDAIQAADLGRVELAARHDVDVIAERGWYSSVDFWSPRLFRRHFKPRIAELAAACHRHGKRFAYVMTTGVAALGPELMDAGVDLLYYADPGQDRVDLEWARRAFAGRMAVAGGINTSLTLSLGSAADIRAAVRHALDTFGRQGGFILSPVDALFPDTPWEGVEAMIEAWREWQ
jgi:hypothetical protein